MLFSTYPAIGTSPFQKINSLVTIFVQYSPLGAGCSVTDPAVVLVLEQPTTSSDPAIAVAIWTEDTKYLFAALESGFVEL
jgi:hypothetical protein